MAREYAPGAYSESRTGRVDPAYIYHVDQTPLTQHFFSPFSTKGQKAALNKINQFEHNLEGGWTQKEKNSKKPTNRGEWRMLTNANGNPYLAPIGPAKGKFVMFDAWQSNDELMEIYKKAFEDEWVPGKKVRGVYEFVDPHQHFEEPDGGHIIRIDYNSKLEIMMVHFKNKNSVVCYLGVPQTTIDLLRECVGKKDGSRKAPHNHLLGVRFWDIIRIRGSQTGGNYPFYYIEGGPSSGTFVRNKGLTSYNAKRHVKLKDEMQTDEKNMTKIASEKGRNYSLAQQEIEDEMAKIEDILNANSFHEDFESGDPNRMSGEMADFAISFSELATDTEATWAQKEEFLRDKNNKKLIKELFNSKYAKEDTITAEDIAAAKAADKQLKDYQHKQAIDAINESIAEENERKIQKFNEGALDDDFFADASEIDYNKYDEEDAEWEKKMKKKGWL